MKACVALVLTLALPAGAAMFTRDLVLRQRSTGPAGTQEQTQYFSASKVVIDDSRKRSIVDLAARTLTVANKDKRTFMVMELDELTRQGREAREELAGREASISVTSTGKTANIAGYTAKEFAITGGPITGSVWVTEEVELPLAAREWERLSESLGGQGPSEGRLANELAKLRGLPLRTAITLSLGKEKVSSMTEVVEVQEAAPPPEVLGVPAGFRKVAPAD